MLVRAPECLAYNSLRRRTMDSNDNPTRHTNSRWAITIRAREPDDIATCVTLLADVHAADSYPLHWPADPGAWLTQNGLLATWVAESSSGMVGHVALRSAAAESGASLWSSACDLPPERLAAIARLFAAPSARGHGVGSALLDVACDEARRRGLRPVLDVLDMNQSAITLYERKGWRRVASVPAPWAQADGREHFLLYYISPS